MRLLENEKNKIIKHDNYTDIIIAVLLSGFSFVLMYIATASSFRYAVNPWNDANAFFTVGKAMVNGLVPYRDVFEQKGPLLYGIHALAYLISKTSFTGVYILESIAAAVTGFFAYKTANMYIGKAASAVTAVFTLAFIANSYCFFVGDSAEEFMLPMMMASFYFILKHFKNPEENRMKKRHYFAVGIFVGCALMIKFTLIGFWFGFMAVMMLYTLIKEKKIKDVFLFVLSFAAGVAAAVIPWVIYFALKGALKDFINVYFVINASAYASQKPPTEKAEYVVTVFEYILKNHTKMVLPSLTGALLPAVFKRFSDGKVFSRLAIPVIYITNIFFIYYGGKAFTYYALPLTVFVVFNFIFMFSLIRIPNKKMWQQIASITVSVILISLTVVGTDYYHCNSVFTLRKGEETYNELIDDYISSHNPDGKILCYGTLDMGVYLLNNYYDVEKHFESQNIPYEKYKENYDEQNRYIDEHEVDYVVVRTPKSDSGTAIIYSRNETLKKDYNLVLKKDFDIIRQKSPQKTDKYTCYLFELKQG